MGNKLGRNELCFCGSGKKYKHCHWLRSGQEPFSPERLVAGLRRAQSYTVCLHPEAEEECSGKIVKAHSIQKGGPIRQIMDGASTVQVLSHVGSGLTESKGWKQASVFEGFCRKHDKEMFSPIEDQPFRGTSEQCFLTGYRSVAFELYRKVAAKQAIPYLKENADRGKSEEDQIRFQDEASVMEMGFEKGIQELRSTLSKYSDLYKSNNYGGVKSLVVYFSGTLDIAVTGAFATEFDLDGNRLQTLSPETEFLNSITVNTMICEDGFALVFTWLDEFQCCEQFAASIEATDNSVLPSRLVELIFAYLENVHFTPGWLDGLNPAVREDLLQLGMLSSHYGHSINFTGNKYVDWEVTSISMV